MDHSYSEEIRKVTQEFLERLRKERQNAKSTNATNTKGSSNSSQKTGEISGYGGESSGSKT